MPMPVLLTSYAVMCTHISGGKFSSASCPVVWQSSQQVLKSTLPHRVYLNPGAGERRTGIASSPWASQEGQDFLTNNVVPDVDFATVHIWMDNWMGYADYSTCILCNNNFDYTYGAHLLLHTWTRRPHVNFVDYSCNSAPKRAMAYLHCLHMSYVSLHNYMPEVGYGRSCCCSMLANNPPCNASGGNVWEEKRDYTVSWLNAHFEDATALGKPLLVEEFGKAISAAKVYTGQLPHSPEKGTVPSVALPAAVTSVRSEASSPFIFGCRLLQCACGLACCFVCSYGATGRMTIGLPVYGVACCVGGGGFLAGERQMWIVRSIGHRLKLGYAMHQIHVQEDLQVRPWRPTPLSGISSSRQSMGWCQNQHSPMVQHRDQTSGTCTLWALRTMTHSRSRWLTPPPWTLSGAMYADASLSPAGACMPQGSCLQALHLHPCLLRAPLASFSC